MKNSTVIQTVSKKSFTLYMILYMRTYVKIYQVISRFVKYIISKVLYISYLYIYITCYLYANPLQNIDINFTILDKYFIKHI